MSTKILIEDEKIRETLTNEMARHIIATGSTIRETAKVFGMSKSTVHRYLKEFLRNEELRLNVNKVLQTNKAERHIRGGNATKLRYIKTLKEEYIC